MNQQIFSSISKIIERDSKSTTYKFALLRGVIDIISDNSPYIKVSSDRVSFPLGLLIEKWMIYYYPILESDITIPQINGNNKLAFEDHLKHFVDLYHDKGGLSAFYNDLKYKGFPDGFNDGIISLTKQLKQTITKMPMKYIGSSIYNQHYSVFKYQATPIKTTNEKFDLRFLIEKYGEFSIPYEFYEAFKMIGNFIGGRDSILFKWAEFSVSASRSNLSIEQVLNSVLKTPITERNISDSKKLYRGILESKGNVYCVWSGDKISKYDIDHIIPFSIWRNNDLWNLLPARSSINRKKSDKIPTPELITRQSDLILEYWETIIKFQSTRFVNEIQISLLGNDVNNSWEYVGIEKLQESCDYLINQRGYEAWQY